MAAGITDELWALENIVALMDARIEARTARTGPGHDEGRRTSAVTEITPAVADDVAAADVAEDSCQK
jgi:hypothetical protein